MPDKDQFTFDDDDGFQETNLDDQKNSPASDLADDFPEDDLSAAFSDGEHEAETPIQEEAEPIVKSGGGSTMRIALMVLLLVVAGAGGAYYFMDLGGTTLSVPTVPIPVQKAKKSVALPPPPAKTPVAPAPTPVPPTQAEEVSKPVTAAVSPPSPPVESVSEAAAKPQPVPVPQAAKKVVVEQSKSAKQTTTQAVVPTPKVAPTPEAAPAPQAKPTATKATSTSVPVSQKTAVEAPPSPKPVASPKQVADGAYTLDAGSYLLESNQKTLATKINKLGYEPSITPINATLDMTRLRLGTFSKDEVQEALDFARTIEPGSYSAPAGDQYVIYAGTFLNSRNIEKLTKRLLAEGIRVYPEPVQVVRTLSRVRFGSFATKEEAAAAAREVSGSGVKAVVVKSK
jgi:cell division protein FtsN